MNLHSSHCAAPSGDASARKHDGLESGRSAGGHTPGPWRVEPWHGGEGYAKGYYVARTLPSGKTEWMKSVAHPRKARRFATEERARAAIAKATGEQS